MKNNLTNLLVFVIGALALITLSLYFARRFRSQMRPFYENIENLAQTLQGTPIKLMGCIDFEPALIGSWAKDKYTLKYCSSDFGALPHILRLELYKRSPIRLSIFANNMRPSKVLFLKKLHTGNADLDKFDFYSNKPEEAKTYLLSHQATLKELTASGWSIPSFGRRSISIYADISHSIDAGAIKVALQNLAELRN